MTWILAADDASEDELREIAAHQRELADERRKQQQQQQLVYGAPVPAGYWDFDHPHVSWPRRLYARVYVFLTALRPC